MPKKSNLQEEHTEAGLPPNASDKQGSVTDLQNQLERLQTTSLLMQSAEASTSEKSHLLMDVQKQLEQLEHIIGSAQKMKKQLQTQNEKLFLDDGIGSPGSPVGLPQHKELKSIQPHSQGSFFSKRYKVRSGTKDSGREYEHKIAALLSLRCLSADVGDMWVAMNADGVGSFDDIILILRTPTNSTSAYLLQLKHKEKPRNVTEAEFRSPKGDFSISKYFGDIVKLKQQLESDSNRSDIITNLKDFANVHFILFTNRSVNNYDFLVKDNDEMWSFLNTSGFGNAVCSVDYSKFSLNINTAPASNNFRFLSSQVGVKHLDKEIAKEVKRFSGISGIVQSSFKTQSEIYIKFIADWSVGNLGGHYSLTRQDILEKLTEIFLCQYELKLDEEPFACYNCARKMIWNEVLAEQSITIIDTNNHEIIQFLKEYIGCEIRRYCKNVTETTAWADRLSNQAQNLFYQENEDLKDNMLRTIGNSGRITLMDIYKCLCKLKKIPLLLEINKLQDYENILQILKISNYCCNVIIINKTSKSLAIDQIKIKPFCYLQHLNDSYKTKILNNSAMLQGRPSASLSNLLTHDMFEHITTSDIIRILCNNFNIGQVLNVVPAYYIERSFAKVFIEFEALEELSDELFLLENYSETCFDLLPKTTTVCNMEDIDLNCTVITVKKGENLEKVELKTARKPIHYLYFHDGCLEWKWSRGSKEGMIPFMYMEDKFKTDVSDYYNNDVNIISEVPGMGKSTLLDYVAQHSSADNWVLRIDLNAHNEYYRSDNCKNSNTSADKHLTYFSQFQNNTKLSEKVFMNLLNSKHVIVLFDGFDEASVSYKNEVRNIVQSIHKAGYPVWLTTRPVMQEYLEEEFNTKSLVLRPFTPKEQQRFLISYFSINNNCALESETLLRRFVKDLLQAAKHNLNDRDANFASIPLQIKLLADVFNEDCRKYLNSKGTISFKSNFDLLYLYEHFINKKMEILCCKFGSGATDIHRKFRSHQKLLALKLLFQLDTYVETTSTNILKNYCTHYKGQMDEIQLLQKDGIIMVDEYFNITCVHRTYAEYLAAQWLSENLEIEEEQEAVQFLLRIRFTYSCEQFFFNIFDRIVAKNCPLHLSVINGQTGETKRILDSDPNSIKEVDRCGRTLLHMIGLYGIQFPIMYDYSFLKSATFNTDAMLDIIKMIPDNVILDTEFDMMMYTPLDYAIANRSFTIADYLCARSPVLTINSYFNLLFKGHCLRFCVALGYNQLLDILLPYFASRELLLKVVDKNLTFATYVENQNLLSMNIKESIGQKTTLEVLKSDTRSPYLRHINNYYLDLRYAVVFGSEQNVKNLLFQNPDINKYDVDNYTPLHYAIMHGKSKIVETLLSYGASANKLCGSNNDTPLHLTVMNHNKNTPTNSDFKSVLDMRFINITSALLSNGADLNIQNLSGETPLQLALQKSEIETESSTSDKQMSSLLKLKQKDLVTLFLSNENVHKCDVNKQDRSGRTALHLASTGNIAKLLISTGANVNLDDNFGETPLCSAAASGFAEVVMELLSHGADVNKQDMFGFTPLHSAKTEEIASLLILYGADVNVADKDGATPLHLALQKSEIETESSTSHKQMSSLLNLKQMDLVTLFLSNENVHKCDVNKQDRSGRTALHFASDGNIAKLLISSGANVNLDNNFGETPLRSAAASGFDEVVMELLSHGADVNKQDMFGFTPLHSANTEDIASLLVLYGADVNIAGKDGATALHHAASFGLSGIVKVLLVQGCDVNKQDCNGNTPLDLAQNKNVADLLILNGADPLISVLCSNQA